MASPPEQIQDFLEELICAICRDYFTNPVSIECGHSFCHCCILRSWKETSTPFSCPECRSVSQMRDFQINIRLGKLASIAKNTRSNCLQYSEGHGKCEAHQKGQKLFCEDDKRPVCVSCSHSKEHEAHRFQCIDEAAENFRRKLQETMTDLWRKTDTAAQQLTNEKAKLGLLEKVMKIRKKTIVSEFQKIKQFLNEEKNAYLSAVQTQGQTNLENLRKRISGLSQQNQELRKRITELKEECERPNVDLLQDVKGMMLRNEAVLQKEIGGFPLEIVYFPIFGILDRLYTFKVDITLDCNTADSGLIVSEDLKSVTYEGVQHEAPNNEKLLDLAQILGSQSFVSSRHYWEVEVPDNTAWCVGICKKSEKLENVFGLMNVQRNNSNQLYVVSQHNLYNQVHLKYRQLCESNLKVGIFLDYERGEVSFYHVNKRYLIYTFLTTSFSGPLKPLFCLSRNLPPNNCFLRICP